MYADDGVIFGATEEPSCTHEEAGVRKEATKSRWVKYKGQYLTSLKFLGLEYIPPGISGKGEERVENYPRIRSNTRNGTQVEFDTYLQYLCFLSTKYKESYNTITSLLSRTLKSLTDDKPTSKDELVVKKRKAVNLDLNDIKEVMDPNLTIETWIEDRWKEFEELSWNDRLSQLFTSVAGPVCLARMYNGSCNLLTVADTRLTYSASSWASKKWATYLFEEGVTAEYAKLIRYLLDQKKIVLPEIELPEKDSTARKEWFKVYTSLFKLRKDPKAAWNVGKDTSSDFLKLRRFLKWILRVVRLDLDNSSTFACDNLLNYLSSKGDIAGWSKSGRETLGCKAGFEKRIERGLHKQEFEANKENLLRRQRLKLKKELKGLHKDLIYDWKSAHLQGRSVSEP